MSSFKRVSNILENRSMSQMIYIIVFVVLNKFFKNSITLFECLNTRLLILKLQFHMYVGLQMKVLPRRPSYLFTISYFIHFRQKIFSKSPLNHSSFIFVNINVSDDNNVTFNTFISISII